MQGFIEEVQVDSFNLPIFIPTASEVTEVISEIEGLSLEVVEEIQYPQYLNNCEDIRMGCLHLRAITEDILSQHFEPAIIDMIFERIPQKLEEFSRSPSCTNTEKLENLFLLVKKVPVSTEI